LVRKLPHGRSLGYLHKFYAPLSDRADAALLRRLPPPMSISSHGPTALVDNCIALIGYVETITRQTAPEAVAAISMNTENELLGVVEPQRWEEGWTKSGSPPQSLHRARTVAAPAPPGPTLEYLDQRRMRLAEGSFVVERVTNPECELPTLLRISLDESGENAPSAWMIDAPLASRPSTSALHPWRTSGLSQRGVSVKRFWAATISVSTCPAHPASTRTRAACSGVKSPSGKARTKSRIGEAEPPCIKEYAAPGFQEMLDGKVRVAAPDGQRNVRGSSSGEEMVISGQVAFCGRQRTIGRPEARHTLPVLLTSKCRKSGGAWKGSLAGLPMTLLGEPGGRRRTSYVPGPRKVLLLPLERTTSVSPLASVNAASSPYRPMG
jgi:hypothetical protein